MKFFDMMTPKNRKPFKNKLQLNNIQNRNIKSSLNNMDIESEPQYLQRPYDIMYDDKSKNKALTLTPSPTKQDRYARFGKHKNLPSLNDQLKN